MGQRSLRLVEKVTGALGSIPAIVSAFLLVTVWAVFGLATGVFPEDKYQLVINTTTTCITFLMVFVIQNSQNRDSQAVEAKLDELIRALKEARDEFQGIEELPEKEIRRIKEDERP